MIKTVSHDPGTRERLLETAAGLFAARGFEGVSLRDLTQAAGVNLAAVNYHFGSREKLIECLIERMMNPMNEERLAMLAEARARAGKTPVMPEEILSAFLRPVVSRVKSSAMSEQLFSKLMGRCLTDRANRLPESVMPLLERVVREFGAALRECAPWLDAAQIVWRMNFTIGALLNTLVHRELLERLGKGKVRADDADGMLEQLIEFSAAGFRQAQPTRAPRRASLVGALKMAPVVVAMLALASCAAVSPKSRMDAVSVPVPGSWAAGKMARAGVDSEWVRRFGDGRLNALVDEALRNSHDLKIAAARVEKARSQAVLAGVAGNPTSDLTFQGDRAKRNFIGFPIGGPGAGVASSQSKSFGLTLDIKWEADIWGRIAAGKSAALAMYESAQMDERAARTSIAGSVAKAWFGLVEAQAQLKLAREAQGVYEETATAVRERFKAGNEAGGAGAQLRLAESDVANAKALVLERQQQVSAATRQLEALLARYPSGDLKSVTDLPAVPSTPPSGLPSELLQRRPDVLAAERRLASAGMRLKEARRAIFPRLALTANGGTSTDDLAQLLNSDFGVWQLAGNVIQPILAGGTIRGEIASRNADESEALAQLQKTVLGAFSEVEIALVSEGLLAAREAALGEATRLAADADKAARADYKDGVGDILTVFAAQGRNLQTRMQMLAVRRLRLENRVNLHLALGGDYQPRPAK